ncbi:hypothetical protein F9C11_20795 [Amycolatopsis sp. VS8301801F10]|uniref:hypothetical protein n=1 Tax=Amycolatopsis sp. VS8301801F10 TaxID=2652442 RepID=UPI0038FCF2CE
MLRKRALAEENARESRKEMWRKADERKSRAGCFNQRRGVYEMMLACERAEGGAVLGTLNARRRHAIDSPISEASLAATARQGKLGSSPANRGPEET